jgi:metal transporter CNNM
MEIANWIGITLCILQSGIFSGLNLAVFSVSTIQLRAKAQTGNKEAAQLMNLRMDSNFLLATILWGNVGTNVLLTLLSDSVMAGLAGFIFSTVIITVGGEIIPQAYFSRNAMRMASLLRPVLRFWQIALYPLAKPTALILDAWLGKEGIEFMREKEIREAIKIYIEDPDSEVSEVEGLGASNFLSLDDIRITEEGEPVSAASILPLPMDSGQPVFPYFKPVPDDPFLKQVEASGHKWVIIASPEGEPLLALDSDGFLRAVLFSDQPVSIRAHCHRPIVIRNGATPLGEILPRLKARHCYAQDDVIEDDLILYWCTEKRIITGADLLGRLLRGIPQPLSPEKQSQ